MISKRGVLRELMNRRGVVGRGRDEDGHRERDLADKYLHQAVLAGDRWPRAAGLLRRVADHYKIDVAECDRIAEIRQSSI
jgi:hypothetical protein